MAPDKRVMVAHEPDGRLYGPAIFRTYYEGMGHEPHFDSVRDRTRLLDMQVSRFDKQFAAILCMQESLLDDEKGQTLLYRQQWSPEINDKLLNFRAYAKEEGIERVSVNLEPGDFYVFHFCEFSKLPKTVPLTTSGAFNSFRSHINYPYCLTLVTPNYRVHMGFSYFFQ